MQTLAPRPETQLPLPEEPQAPPQQGGSLLRRVLQDRARLLREIALGEQVPLARVAAFSFLLTALGGLALGISSGPLQALSAAVKTPLITLCSLVVCFPAFYIFGVLRGSRIQVEQALRFFAVGLGLRGAILAGLAPILLFFGSVGSPYGFLLLLGGVVFGAAELCFLRTVEAGISALREERGDQFHPYLVRAWQVLYLAVIVQMTWTLRPLIGHPSIEEFVLVGGPGNVFTYFVKNVVLFFVG